MLALLASCQPLAVSGQRNYIFDFTDRGQGRVLVGEREKGVGG